MIGWLDGLVGSLPGDLNLYQALRRPQARSGALGAGAPARARSPPEFSCCRVAAACRGGGVALRRSGTVYVEARLG